MRSGSGKRWLAALALCLCVIGAARAQDAARLHELRVLRDQLQRNNSLRGADLLVVLSERAVNQAARELVGLDIVLSGGSVLHVTSVESELRAGAAQVKIGVQAKSSVTINLQLIGRIGSGELVDGVLRLPMRVTDVVLGNGKLSGLFIKTMFGDWLKAEKWNAELPALELPVEVANTFRVPASKFETTGAPPMEIETPELAAPVRFTLGAMFVLPGRIAFGLRSGSAPPAEAQVSQASPAEETRTTLEDQIDALGQNLATESDLRVRVSRRVLSDVLTQLAAAQPVDLKLKLRRGRLRAEEVSSIIRTTNYTDVETGQGRADINALGVERIADGQINVAVSGQGEMDVEVRGREYGVPYSLTPHVTFAIKNQIIPMQLATEGERVFLRAAPGATLPIEYRLSTSLFGREFGLDQTTRLQADCWLNRLELPALFASELPLPRRLEVQAEGGFAVKESRPLRYTLSNLRARAGEDALELTADVVIARP